MMLLSGMFCGDNHSFDFTPTDVANINNLRIHNGIYDEVFATKDTTKDYSEEVKVWDFDTLLYSLFKNNLFGGNVEFAASTVSAIRIKRRKKGDFNWDTIVEIPVKTNADFQFERFDRYARGNTEYEYSLVPMLDNVEGNLNTNSIKSEFEGFYFIDKDTIFQAILNTQLSTTRNHNSTTISTLGRKYPFHVSNGKSNYTTGQLQASFVDVGLDCTLDLENGWKYREAVDDFLTNGKPKILKNGEGKMWMVAIVDSVPQDLSNFYLMPVHTVSWAEIGNVDDVGDMYDNGFINVDTRLVR